MMPVQGYKDKARILFVIDISQPKLPNTMKHRQILIGKQKESITPQTQHKQWT
jgi:hypothetical protein